MVLGNCIIDYTICADVLSYIAKSNAFELAVKRLNNLLYVNYKGFGKGPCGYSVCFDIKRI